MTPRVSTLAVARSAYASGTFFELPVLLWKNGIKKIPAGISGIKLSAHQPFSGIYFRVNKAFGTTERTEFTEKPEMISLSAPCAYSAVTLSPNVLGHDLAFHFKTVSERITFRSSGYHSAIDLATLRR